MPTILQTPSPNHDGKRATTLGCVIHSTRGGASSLDAEFRATTNWFANPASQVSAHIVIATDGTIAQCVYPDNIAWHARSFNADHLGAELVQPKMGDHITDDQLKSLAWWLQRQAVRYGFALTLANLPEHKDIPPGIADGKTDVGTDYSFARLAPFLGQPIAPQPVPVPTPAPPTPVRDTITALVGKTEADVINLLGQPDALENTTGDGFDHLYYYGAVVGAMTEIVIDSGIVKAVNFT